jgi:hypothetical protein
LLGNVASTQPSNINGISVAYTDDSLNRLSTVVDNRLPARQNTTTYAYDPASNLATVTYPNAVGIRRLRIAVTTMKLTHLFRIALVLIGGAFAASYWAHTKPMPLWQMGLTFLLLAPLAWFDYLRRWPLLTSVIPAFLWTVTGAGYWLRRHDLLSSAVIGLAAWYWYATLREIERFRRRRSSSRLDLRL